MGINKFEHRRSSSKKEKKQGRAQLNLPSSSHPMKGQGKPSLKKIDLKQRQSREHLYDDIDDKFRIPLRTTASALNKEVRQDEQDIMLDAQEPDQLHD